MANQKINDIGTITTISSTDRILVNTDIVNNILEQIEKDDFVADIISTDSGNLLDVGADNKLAVIDSTITLQGNTFNGNSQLIQTNSSGQYPALDGSLITNVSVTIDKTIMQIGTCSTASATAEKAVTSSGFVLATGATIQVTFTNANSADVPTLNVNSTGAKAIYNEAGTAVSATNPAYFPAGSTVEFTYDGTNWVFKKRIVENYVNGGSWYRVHSDGWIEQGGVIVVETPSNQGADISLSFLKQFNQIPTLLHSYTLAINTNVNGGGSLAILPNSLTTTGAYIRYFDPDSGLGRYIWEAKGY